MIMITITIILITVSLFFLTSKKKNFAWGKDKKERERRRRSNNGTSLIKFGQKENLEITSFRMRLIIQLLRFQAFPGSPHFGVSQKRDFLGRCCGVASALPTEVYWHPHSAYQRNLALPAAAKWHKGRWDWALALANRP